MMEIIQKESYFQHHKSVIFVLMFTQSATFSVDSQVTDITSWWTYLKKISLEQCSMRIADIAANKIKLICDDNSMNWSCRILFRRITWNKKMDSAGQILMIGLIFITEKEEMVIWISWYKIVWNSEMDIPENMVRKANLKILFLVCG